MALQKNFVQLHPQIRYLWTNLPSKLPQIHYSGTSIGSVATVQLGLANAQLCRFWKSVAQKLSGAILPSTRLHQLWLKSQLVDGSHLYLDFNYLSQIYRLDSSCNRRIKPFMSSGTVAWSLKDCSKSNISASLLVPSVKSSPRSCFSENLSICNASIRLALIRFRRAVVVSFADEKTRSHGTAEPCIGKMSSMPENNVGKRSWLSCRGSIKLVVMTVKLESLACQYCIELVNGCESSK